MNLSLNGAGMGPAVCAGLRELRKAVDRTQNLLEIEEVSESLVTFVLLQVRPALAPVLSLHFNVGA